MMQKKFSQISFKILTIVAAVIAFAVPIYVYVSHTPKAHAATVEELRAKIDEHTANIASLEEDIKKYQVELVAIGKQTTSLKSTLAGLALSKKKLETELQVTQNKIDTINLQIKRLSLDISAKQDNISDNRLIIAQSLSKMYQSSSGSVLEAILREQSLSNAFTAVDHLAYLQFGVRDRIQDLEVAKLSLEDNKRETEKKKAELVDLTKQLGNQTKLLAETTQQQTALLASTKNTETTFKKTLADKIAARDALQREIDQAESALRIAVDPNSIPKTGGVLLWPLDRIIITQYFGNTPFATKNPQVYNGKGHTGVDFGASIGTPVHAALSGKVIGVANTDLVRGCYSYGKWIMIEHPNGLSTLYGHLSLQNVSVGQEVSTGDIIGYSGNTGYSTGPHLHFGVYASEGVRITLFTNSKTCRNATIPLADPTAYLNPLSFLPPEQ